MEHPDILTSNEIRRQSRNSDYINYIDYEVNRKENKHAHVVKFTKSQNQQQSSKIPEVSTQKKKKHKKNINRSTNDPWPCTSLPGTAGLCLPDVPSCCRRATPKPTSDTRRARPCNDRSGTSPGRNHSAVGLRFYNYQPDNPT